MIDTKIQGKVALITGCNNPFGVGAATANALAEERAKIVAQYLCAGTEASSESRPGESFYRAQQAKSPDELVRTIRERGGQIEAREADLSEPEAIPRLFDQAEKIFGPVSVLINNAAHCDPDTFLPQKEFGSDGRAVDGFPMVLICVLFVSSAPGGILFS